MAVTQRRIAKMAAVAFLGSLAILAVAAALVVARAHLHL